MCIDYRKLNKATQKYNFPLPFIDLMLERLAKHSYFIIWMGIYVSFESLSIQGLREDNFHSSLRYFCIPKDAFWFV